MNCSTCEKPLIFNGGMDGTWETCVGYVSPPGHNHDDNCQTRIYRCENGHRQVVSKRRRCPACNWRGRETCFCHPAPKVDEWPDVAEPGVATVPSSAGDLMSKQEEITMADNFVLRWPTDFPGRITQPFGADPEGYGKMNLPGHEGLDFYAPTGSNIYAAHDGIVFVTPSQKSLGIKHVYGNHVRIRTLDGKYSTVYAHLSVVYVREGQGVVVGQVIGLAGNTGNSKGGHLHFSLKKAGATASGETNYPYDIINPTPYFAELKAPECHHA